MDSQEYQEKSYQSLMVLELKDLFYSVFRMPPQTNDMDLKRPE